MFEGARKRIEKTARALTLATVITLGTGTAEACPGNPNLPSQFELNGQIFTIPPHTTEGTILEQNGTKIQVLGGYQIEIDGNRYKLRSMTRSLVPSCNNLNAIPLE